MKITSLSRLASHAGLVMACLLLSGCFFAPGKFTSQLTLLRDGAFTFAYQGELHFVALSDMARQGSRSGSTEFTPGPCQDDETWEERPCTSAEINEQRAEWEERNAREEREAQQMSAMIGGIDPSDPEAGEEFAALLRRQAGWQSVDYKGDGLFDVRYEMSSRIGHSFAFPALESFPLANDLVSLAPRQDGSVRIDASGFGPAMGNPMAAMMMGAQSLGGDGETEGPDLPTLDGSFTILTDGEILANNTDDGPAITAEGLRSLNWRINARSAATPMALIRLER